jgi:cell division protein FtsW
MAKRVSVDKWMFAVTLLLVVIGLVMVFSASAVVASERHQSPYAFLWKQLVYAAIGFVAMFAAMHIDYKRYKHPALVFTSLAVPAVLLVAVFFLDRSHNTHRWIRFAGFSFQPRNLRSRDHPVSRVVS